MCKYPIANNTIHFARLSLYTHHTVRLMSALLHFNYILLLGKLDKCLHDDRGRGRRQLVDFFGCH